MPWVAMVTASCPLALGPRLLPDGHLHLQYPCSSPDIL